MKPLVVIRYALLYCFYGSVLFWLPDALWHRFRPEGFAGIDAILLSILLPAIVLLGLRTLLRSSWSRMEPLLVAFLMDLGILVTGPLWMMISGRLGGGGFPDASWRDVAKLTLLFPLADLEISTYDGTLLALVASFFGLLILAGRRTHDSQTSSGQEA